MMGRFARPDLAGFARAAALAALLLAAPLVAAAQTTLPAGFRDSLVVAGLTSPIGMAFLPDGRALVIEQKTAAIKLVRQGVASTVFTVPGVNTTGEERGLLGIAVDPGWPLRPYLYLHLDSTVPLETIRLTRYTVGGDLDNTATGVLTIDANSRRDILSGVPDQYDNHNGGTVRFGPDGMLYASFGDDAARCPAQDQVSLRGVIVRLDVSGVPAGGGPEPARASIAATGNPLINATDDRSRLLWSWGLRNPFRFHVDPAGGALYIADVGENNWEEVDRAATGGLNFGWPAFEGFVVMDDNCPLTGAHATPIHVWNHSTGGVVVVTAGVYRRPPVGKCRDCFPASYEGNLFVTDYYGGFMRRLAGSGDTWDFAVPVAGQPDAETWATGFQFVADFGIGPGGGLWYCDQGAGQIRAILGPVRDDTTAPPPGPPVPGNRIVMAAPYPQPAAGSVSLRFTMPSAGRASLRIYDLAGSLVRVLDGDFFAGQRVVVWDGRNHDGERVPSGLYVARVEFQGSAGSQRVMLVR